MTDAWPAGPFLVAGPCVLEEDSLTLRVAETVAGIGARLGLPVIFKASYLKANRTHPDAPRGPGLEAGLDLLARVARDTGVPVLTDVHETSEVAAAAQAARYLQIPAFLCRQTPLLEAAGRTGRPVNVKKGQWMAADAMSGAVAKLRGTGAPAVALTERGTFFGYGDLVVDMRNVGRLRAAGADAVLFDATHAVQRPGAHGAAGDRDAVPTLLAAAAAAGVDGFFLETHPDPARAPSDAATMWPLGRLEDLLARTLAVWHGAREGMIDA